MIKRAHGFSDAILENADKVLRLPLAGMGIAGKAR